MNTKGESTLSICKKKLKYFNYSDHTIRLYLHYINQFLKSQSKSAAHLNADDFNNYLIGYNFTSVSQQNQIINAIKFLYEKVLNKKYDKVCFERPRKEKRLPQVIDKEFLLSKINSIDNLKHKAIISIAYSTGLRVSEVINLKIDDIDSKRGIINIRQAKGNKDRIVPLSDDMLTLLRNYYKEYKPNDYLFNGQLSPKYTSSSCNKLVKHYVGYDYRFHTLRHSSFTSMLENGTDLRVIQKIAGHSSSKTTEIYTHVSVNILKNAKTPI